MWLVLLFLVSLVRCGCIHNKIAKPAIYGQKTTPMDRRTQTRLSIQFHLDNDSISVPTQDLQNYFAEMYKMVSSNNNLNVTVCREDNVHTIVELKHDLLIHIDFGKQCTEHADGYAFVCRIDGATQRPISGFIGLCNPYFMANTAKRWKILVHEITHVMAFSSDLFPFYKGCDGPCIRKTATGEELFMGPRALAYAREFFDCNEIDGIQLDDSGSHFRMDKYDGQLMVPVFVDNVPEIMESKLLFAVIADSGWYEPLKYGNDSIWGWRRGCHFVNYDCNGYYDRLIEKEEVFYCMKKTTTDCIVYNYGRYIGKIHRQPELGGLEEHNFCPVRRNYHLLDYKKVPKAVPRFTYSDTIMYKRVVDFLQALKYWFK